MADQIFTVSLTSRKLRGALIQRPKSWRSSHWPCFPCSNARASVTI